MNRVSLLVVALILTIASMASSGERGLGFMLGLAAIVVIIAAIMKELLDSRKSK